MKVVSTILLVVLVELAWCGMALCNTTVSIDFEEQPVPDFSEISNTYYGGARTIYAFLVVREGPTDEGVAYVSAFDLGYRLICLDGSVVNHGFSYSRDWQSLSEDESGFPSNLVLPRFFFACSDRLLGTRAQERAEIASRAASHPKSLKQIICDNSA